MNIRNCDNCDNGSYGMNCNTGVETLYCRESEYEYEVTPNDVCDSHQYIDGMENEKNYILYDDSYFGKGYFIINTIDGEIVKFLKLFITNSNGFPDYYLRAFSVDARDNPDTSFNNIEFVFRSNEDYDNGLFEIFSMFCKKVDKEIYSIDKLQHGRNNISVSRDGEIIKLIVSKDVYRGKQHSTDFVDVYLGDIFSCENYEVINYLYNELENRCSKIATLNDVNKILELKLR